MTNPKGYNKLSTTVIASLRTSFVSLDSSTLGNLARDYETDEDAKSIFELFKTGSIVPFLTWHHLAELSHHQNDDVFEKRWNFLRNLPLVCFQKTKYSESPVGSIIELRSAEIDFLLENANFDLANAIAAIRPNVCNGVETGTEFFKRNYDFWHFYRRNFSEENMQRSARIASITHFPTVDFSKPLYDGGKLRTPEEARAYFSRLASTLGGKLSTRGDKRLNDPMGVAAELMRETFETATPSLWEAEDPLQHILQIYGIDKSRLPKKPTIGDAAYEGVFVGQMGIVADSMKIPRDLVLAAASQWSMPSWKIWRFLDEHVRQDSRARGSNLTDKQLSCWGIYLDGIEVDKRMREYIRQGTANNSIIDALSQRLIRGGTYRKLLQELEKINPAI